MTDNAEAKDMWAKVTVTVVAWATYSGGTYEVFLAVGGDGIPVKHHPTRALALAHARKIREAIRGK